jgi:deoxyribose-phosphate aldolase
MGMMADLKSADIAKMIDHSILHPTITDEDLRMNCKTAKKYNIAAACVKAYHTKMAAELLEGSDVKVCSVVGFPHGSNSIEIKAVEAVQAIKDGAAEIDMVINIGKTLQRDWNYIGLEINVILAACRKYDALLKVIFETDYITRDADKIELCKLCSKSGVPFVKTSTGFGFVKGADGKYSYTGATQHDVELMRKHCTAGVQIKAAGGIRSLDQVMEMRELGASRIGTTSTVDIMEEAGKRFA